MLESFKNYKNSIGYTLFKKVYFTYFVLFVIFTSYQIFVQYHGTKEKYIESFSNIEKVYTKLYEKHIISENIYELNQLSNAIVSTTNISSISINRIDKEFTFNTEPKITYSQSNILKHTIELKSLETTYCEINLYIENSSIYENIKESVVLMLINLAAGMIILWILFVIFIAKHLVSPLNKIIEGSKKFDIIEHEIIEIDLENKEKNELNRLANTINKMSKSINEAYINMQQLTMIREIQKDKLEDQKKELIAANKAKDDFLANMSHELKTPLNSINVISDVMMRNKKQNLDEKQIKNLEIVNKCGKDLLFLINDILDISKLEAGQIILNNSPIKVHEFITTIYDMFYPQTKEKKVDFIIDIDENIDSIFSDEDRIKQIIKNLLSNALKFTDEGKKIFLLVEDNDKNIKVIIKDEGIGIPKEKLEHIFDRFKQVDGSTTRKYGGTGLGLAICKELALLLKGDIKVSSTLDKGSEFEITIPKNEELMTSLDILDIKSDKKEIVSSEKKEEVSKNIDDEVPIEKEIVYVLNNNPIEFFQTIILLNKKYEVKQSSKLDEIINLYKKSICKVFIDLKSLEEGEILKIKENIDESHLMDLDKVN